MKRTFLILALIFSINFLIAQDAKWTIPFDGWVSWMKPLTNGTLFVLSDKGLSCLNPEDGSILWNNPAISKYEFKECNPIVFTNLVVFGTLNPKIINAKDGKIVFNGESSGITSLSFQKILPDLSSILILGNSDSGNILFLVDYTTGSVKWTTNLGKDKSGASKLAAKFVSSYGPETTIFDNDFKLTADGNLLFTSKGTLFKINLVTGEIKWQYKPEKEKAKMFYITPDNKNILLVSGSVTGVLTGDYNLESLNLETGTQNWKEISYNGVFDKIQFDEDAALINGSGTFQRLDYKTGKALGQEYKAFGMVAKKIIKTDKGYIIVKEQNEDDNIVYYIDFNGNEIWKRGVTSSRIHDIGLNENELFVFSRYFFGAWDLATGKEIKEMKNGIGWVNIWTYDKKSGAYIGYSSIQKKLLKMSKIGYKVELLAEIPNFKAEETPALIEIREKGYLLSSLQNLYMAGKQGEQLHHTYYPKSGSSLADQIFKYSSSTPVRVELEITDPVKNLYKTNNVDKEIFERYTNVINNSSSSIILTTSGKVPNQAISVLSIDKDSGKVLKQINLQKDNPIFNIDPIYKTLYYKSGPHEISAYKL